MNDELRTMITRVLLVALTSLATRLHMADGNSAVIGAVAADLADLAVLAWSIYNHRGMKKVPVAAQASLDGVIISQAGSTIAAKAP